jgi:hypothetical protein
MPSSVDGYSLKAGSQPEPLKSEVLPIIDTSAHVMKPHVDDKSTGPAKGIFDMMRRWHPSDADWGDEVPLIVFPGDRVYVSEVDSLGWARGTLLRPSRVGCGVRGNSGWFPFSFCKRAVFTAVSAHSGDDAKGYLTVNSRDHVVVYHQNDGRWMYGAALGTAGFPVARGWFLSEILDHGNS